MSKNEGTNIKPKPKRGKKVQESPVDEQVEIKTLGEPSVDDDCVSVAPSEVDSVATTATLSKRKSVTKEMVMSELDSLVDSLEKEILSMRESSTKTQGIRFLKSLNKEVKKVRNHAARVLGQRKKNPNHNTNSGLLKQVKISEELAKFAGWSSDELKSRVEVTTHICKYIKENKLQNTSDGRKIIPDDKLTALLKYDPSKELTYYSIQSLMKPHFIKE